MADRALLVGINNYLKAPYNTRPLRAAVNDVGGMHRYIATALRFDPKSCLLLLNENATTQNIVRSLEKLIEGLSPGDRAFFYFSGHGSRLRYDREIRSVICPYDFESAHSFAIDSGWFHQLFRRIPPGVIFNWVSDSCHSGGLALFADTSRSNAIPKFLEPSPEEAERISALLREGVSVSSFQPGPPSIGGALLSACAAEEQAWDVMMGPSAASVMTHHFISLLLSTGGSTLSLDECRSRLLPETRRWRQTPQLRGQAATKTRPFLS